MSARRRVLVITSCTGLKASPEHGDTLPAERLYTGEQHRRLMAGVDALRASQIGVRDPFDLDLRIVSAGYGLVDATEPLRPYDTTFAGMRKANLLAHAEHLQIPQEFASLLSSEYSLALILLGDDYLRAAGLDDEQQVGGPALAFCGKASAFRIRGVDRLRPIVLGTTEARRYHCGLIGLKGELARRTLLCLAEEPAALGDLSDPSFDPLDFLDSCDPQLEIETAA